MLLAFHYFSLFLPQIAMPYPVSPDPIREQELSSSQDQKKMTGPLSKEALRMHDDDRYEFQ